LENLQKFGRNLRKLGVLRSQKLVKCVKKWKNLEDFEEMGFCHEGAKARGFLDADGHRI